jgi:hypothetical protein
MPNNEDEDFDDEGSPPPLLGKRKQQEPDRPPNTLERPSAYLRDRCPLCFGGVFDKEAKE